MKIGASITTFNPSIAKLRENIAAVISQAERVLIVDNGSGNCDEIQMLLKEFGDDRVILKRFQTNKGISKALNAAAMYFYSEHYDWLITLDQDSVVPPNLTSVYLRYIYLEKAAVLSPIIRYDNGVIDNGFESEKKYKEIDKCITSASMIKLSVWEEVHGFDDKMFIDYVDFDYCFTVREHGYRIYCCSEAILEHELGKSDAKRLFLIAGPKKIRVYNHSPQRTYYYTRNALYFIKKHKVHGLINKKQEYKILLRWLMIKLIYEKNRLKCFKAIIKGMKDSKKLEAGK